MRSESRGSPETGFWETTAFPESCQVAGRPTQLATAASQEDRIDSGVGHGLVADLSGRSVKQSVLDYMAYRKWELRYQTIRGRNLHSYLFIVAAALLLPCGGCLGKTVYKSAPSVSPDVLVVTPADPDFDSELAGLLGDQIQVIKQLEPYVLIVTNRSKRKIVAYSPAWTVTGRYLHGSGQIFNLSLKYPNAVAGTSIGNQFPRGDEIYPGETRIATQGVAGDKNIVRDAELWRAEPHGAAFFKQLAERQRTDFKDPAEVEVGLDAVIFDDGELEGRDRGHLEKHFSAYVNGSQAIDKEIVDAINAGSTIDEVFGKMKAAAADYAADYQTQVDKPDSESYFYNAIAAQDAMSWRREHGDSQLIAHFKGALRDSPFVIWRKSNVALKAK